MKQTEISGRQAGLFTAAGRQILRGAAQATRPQPGETNPSLGRFPRHSSPPRSGQMTILVALNVTSNETWGQAADLAVRSSTAVNQTEPTWRKLSPKNCHDILGKYIWGD